VVVSPGKPDRRTWSEKTVEVMVHWGAILGVCIEEKTVEEGGNFNGLTACADNPKLPPVAHLFTTLRNPQPSP